LILFVDLIVLSKMKGSADMIWEKGSFKISSEKKHVDIDTVHDMIRRSYWARGRTREDVETAVTNSICFSLFKDKKQNRIVLC
jgi:hypothetical protein